MGATQSTVQQVVPTAILTSAKQQVPNAVTAAIKDNNQILLGQDVSAKVVEVSKMFEALNSNDAKGLLDYVNKMNEKLKASGQSELVITPAIRDSLLKFHEVVLSQIDSELEAKNENGYTSLVDDKKLERKKAEYAEIMKKDPQEGIFRVLGEGVGKELADKKKTILESPGIADNEKMKKGVDDIIKSVTSIRVKNKYFEQKYIELNIFLILFVQHVYETMHNFVENVIAYNTIRDANREKIVDNIIETMKKLLGDADPNNTNQNIKDVNLLLGQVKESVKARDEQMKKRLDEMVAVSTANLSQFLGALTPQLLGEIKGATPQPQSSSGGSSQRQRGGFVRDHSRFPQAFYDLSKS